MSEVAEETKPVEVKPKKRGRPAGSVKKSPGRPPKYAKAIPEVPFTEEEHAAASDAREEKVYGFPVKEGFARITVFATAEDGNKYSFFPIKLGDYPRLNLARNRMHVLPMSYVNVITDTVVPDCIEDDCSDPANPIRRYVSKTRFPHSDPIPATKEEFVAYMKQQASLEHPNDYKRRMNGAKNIIA